MAAGSTYTPIATTTLGSAQTSYTFSSIPSTYTDLRIVVTGKTNTGTNPVAQFNGDTGNNYSLNSFGGNGTSASADRRSNQGYAWFGYFAYMDSTTVATGIMDVMNYSNTTTYKTALARFSNAGIATDTTVSLWRSTSAINSILVTTGSANTFSAGSTFTLYGIAAA